MDEVQNRLNEIKKRLAEIEEQTGEKIDLDELLNAVLSRRAVQSSSEHIVNALKTMLSEDVQEHVELGSKKIGKFKVDSGLRIRFLDDSEKEE